MSNPFASLGGRDKFNVVLSVGVAILVMVAGYAVVVSRAVSPGAMLEAEQTAITEPAAIINESSASGGKALRFGGSPSPSLPPSSPAGQTYQKSSIEQYGITWYFDKAYTAGRYANGDWWVKGPVTITRITPDADQSNKRNGWNINPSSTADIGYDGRIGSRDSSPTGSWQNPSLPRGVSGNSSVVKGLSHPTGYSPRDHRGWLKTAAVLTVVSDTPPGNGAAAFRPPYFGAEKPVYLTSNLRTDMLPNIPALASAPSLADIERKFQRVQLDHAGGDEFDSRRMHPTDNMPDYGAKIAVNTSEAALRLMIEGPIASKTPALISYVQAGIDWSAAVKAGAISRATGNGGGHNIGRFLPVAFAATILDNANLKSILNSSHQYFTESHGTYWGNAPVPLYGDAVCSASDYLRSTSGDHSGSRSCRDPAGWIDGGQEPGRYYQMCCVASGYKYAIAAAYIMPQMHAVWPSGTFNKLSRYVDRWVDFGAWTQPDPNNRLFTTSGSHRSPYYHGTNKDGGQYRSTFADNLWKAQNLSDRITTNYSTLK